MPRAKKAFPVREQFKNPEFASEESIVIALLEDADLFVAYWVFLFALVTEK